MEEKVLHGEVSSIEKKKKDIFISILIIIFTSTMMSLTVTMFLTPANLYAGGVTGIGQILLHALELILGREWNTFIYKYLGILNFMLLLPFNFLAFFKLSKKYGLYTFLSSIVQSVVLEISTPLEGLNVFKLSGGYDVIACVLVSSIILGISNGLLMRRGATSGGLIVLCQYLNIKKEKSVGVFNIIISSIIILGGFTVTLFEFKDLSNGISTALYTLLCYVLQSVILDYVHTSYNKVKLEVVTEKGKEIAQVLLKEFNHGITITNGVGAFTNNSKEILNVVIQKYECNKYLSIIREIDKESFISIIPIWRLNGRFNIQIIDK